ncbi:Alpha N-terminal protein methyltransferase 1 [Porphyridium purpureum]|uniref:Alpha N-terminal protein methyltransferase 1 n=1 Tax=Porphyridium purpureum TaxID=35688 RepID=A0A5J4ZAQ7_PORPP|nr:Alpha N-terminal protein methyltransferase 1 [Porphyridium purpureum]|eukprot:POR1254..scf295_1
MSCARVEPHNRRTGKRCLLATRVSQAFSCRREKVLAKAAGIWYAVYVVARMASGKDTDGRRYRSLGAMWSARVGGEEGEAQWYASSKEYWSRQEQSINGMLGGLGELHDTDVAGSLQFIRDVCALETADVRVRAVRTELLSRLSRRENAEIEPTTARSPRSHESTCAALHGEQRQLIALDVGSGIGRVTRGLLMQVFDLVDMLESNPESLAHARELCKREGKLKQLGEQMCAGMEQLGVTHEAQPGPAKYDAIWIQWCVIYLTDAHFVRFLQQCARSLKPGGAIWIKDNVVLRGGFVVDNSDSSITRTEAQMQRIFQQARLQVVLQRQQRDFPESIFPVMMYCLLPVDAHEMQATAI